MRVHAASVPKAILTPAEMALRTASECHRAGPSASAGCLPPPGRGANIGAGFPRFPANQKELYEPKLITAGVIGGTVIGCPNDSTGSSLADILGTWHATAIQATSKSNSANTANLYAQGARLQVTFNADLTYSSSIMLPGQAADNSMGSYLKTATNITLTGDQASGGEIIAFTYLYSKGNGTLKLSGGSISFDFGTGDEASKLEITLTK
jgi:hypothetical protein